MKNSQVFNNYKEFNQESESGFGIVLRNTKTNEYMMPIFEEFYQLPIDEEWEGFPCNYLKLQEVFFEHVKTGNVNEGLTEWFVKNMTDKVREVYTSRLSKDLHYMFFIYDVDPDDSNTLDAIFNHDYTDSDDFIYDGITKWTSLGTGGLSELAFFRHGINNPRSPACSFDSIHLSKTPNLFIETNHGNHNSVITDTASLTGSPLEVLYHVCFFDKEDALRVLYSYNLNTFILDKLVEETSPSIEHEIQPFNDYVFELLEERGSPINKDRWESGTHGKFIEITTSGVVILHHFKLMSSEVVDEIEWLRNQISICSKCVDHKTVGEVNGKYDVLTGEFKDVNRHDLLAYKVALGYNIMMANLSLTDKDDKIGVLKVD